MPDNDSPPTEDRRRVIDDAQAMRALSHPIRVALLDALGVAGPLTATEAAERIGETPTTCSFHLRQLHRYGFVEEVGGGKGRARPWRRTHSRLSFTTEHDDPATRRAAGELQRVYLERNLAGLGRWQETRETYPSAWRNAAASIASVHWLTVEEFDELGHELARLITERFADRDEDPARRPSGAVPIEALVYTYPLDPPNGDPS